MQLGEVTFLIIQKLEHLVELNNPFRIHDMRKAISALLPYAVFLDRSGQRGMIDAISRAVWIPIDPRFTAWRHVWQYIAAMSNRPNPPSLNWVLGLMAPREIWGDRPRNENVVARRTTTTSYTGEVGQSVVNGLLRIVFPGSQQPQIHDGFPEQSRRDLIKQVRTLGDIEILKSYLLLVWSEGNPICDQSGGFSEMLTSIREDFSGIGMGRHRGDLIERLNQILVRLDRGHHRRHDPPDSCDGDIQRTKEQYEELRRVLLEVDRESANTLTREFLRSIRFGSLTLADAYRIPPGLHVCPASPMTVTSRSGNFGLLPPANHFVWAFAHVAVFLPSPHHFRAPNLPRHASPEFS